MYLTNSLLYVRWQHTLDGIDISSGDSELGLPEFSPLMMSSAIDFNYQLSCLNPCHTWLTLHNLAKSYYDKDRVNVALITNSKDHQRLLHRWLTSNIPGVEVEILGRVYRRLKLIGHN